MSEFLKAGVRICSVKVAANQAVVTPPGYLVTGAALGSEGTSGVRRAFLPSSEGAATSFATIFRGIGTDSVQSSSMLKAVLDSFAVKRGSASK
jgi:hypothetical protein